MNKPLIVLVIFYCAASLYGQSWNENQFYVELNNNREGYRFIDTLLAGKKVVLLGELDHGDGSSFIAKTDLIKYLHEHHDFNTLIFEASFINCNFLWNTIGDSTEFRNQIKNNIYNIWSEVEETKNLFRYIEEQYRKGAPLRVVGIDPQFSCIENTQEFIRLLKKTLTSDITESERFIKFIYEIELMSTWMVFPKKKKHKLSEEEFVNYCNILYEAISRNKEHAANLSLWKMYLDNVKIMGKIKRKRNNQSFEMRDEQMFKNADYWIKENANEKFIMWAANAHITRNDRIVEKKGGNFYLLGLKKLGDYLYEAYPDSLYSVAITSGKGVTLDIANFTKKNIIKLPKNNSLEGLMEGKKTCFVDLKAFENRFCLDKYESQMYYTNIICTAKWSQHFDGFIYIPEMSPSTPLWQINRK